MTSVFVLVTSNGDNMPPFIFLNNLRLIVKNFCNYNTNFLPPNLLYCNSLDYHVWCLFEPELIKTRCKTEHLTGFTYLIEETIEKVIPSQQLKTIRIYLNEVNQCS